MGVLLGKVKEVLLSVLPISLIVVILHFTVSPIPPISLARFGIGGLFIVIGLSIFLFGVDLGISPLGNHIGSAISKSNKIWIVIVAGIIIGFFVSIAEPDLQILSAQVSSVTGGGISAISILVMVSIGIGVLLVTGLIRIVYNLPLHKLLTVLYGIVCLLALVVPSEFLAISFDASGATTGALTVPFIMALAIGVSALKKDSLSSESDSFGLVGVTSVGAILGVMLLGIFTKLEGLSGVLGSHASESDKLLSPFFHELSVLWFEALVAIFPLLVIFIAFQIKSFKFPKKQVRRILKGLLYTYVGLVLFLTGVNAGFMDVGTMVGQNISKSGGIILPVAIGFVLGFVTILAEPAVHVLTTQIETVTSGYVRKSVVLGALTIGVGAAVALSILRIVVPQIQLWHYLLPGYIISLAMSYFVPKLFVGIAFDSGGVASGPMTATFVLAFSKGVADSVAGADVLKDAFGMIALVAMTPIITLQTLGFIVSIKSRRINKKGGEDNAKL